MVSYSRSAAEEPAPRFLPSESISSMNRMQGALRRASLNSRATRVFDTPTKAAENSLPATAMKVTPASPASARASSVLPVPGGPTISTPCGGRAPTLAKPAGFFRKLTISASSLLGSSCPATSVKRSGTALAAAGQESRPAQVELHGQHAAATTQVSSSEPMTLASPSRSSPVRPISTSTPDAASRSSVGTSRMPAGSRTKAAGPALRVTVKPPSSMVMPDTSPAATACEKAL